MLEHAPKAALSIGALTPLVWCTLAWADDGGATVAAMPPDAALMVEIVRLLGAPGLALVLGWGLARWKPQITVVVRHELPEGSRLEVVTVEGDVDEEASRPRILPKRKRSGGTDVQ